MKIDLHVHSKYSTRPSQWILQKLGCPESFTDPLTLYRLAKGKGMNRVTITDHNTLAGCLELAHLPDVFLSEEVTTYFPDDGCKAHVLVYRISEEQHEEIRKLRENIFELVSYLRREGVDHVLAHPLYAVNDRLTSAHFEKFLLLFKNLEMNGARDAIQNRCLQNILRRLSPRVIERLVDKHGIVPNFPEPWRKNLTGGSDDHSSLNIARQYTLVEGAATLEDFFAAIDDNQGRVVGRPSSPQTMAHNLYGIAYQFYRKRLRLDRHIHRDPFLRLLDRFLQADAPVGSGLLSRFYCLLGRKRAARGEAPARASLTDLLRHEALRVLFNDPQLMGVLKDGNGSAQNLGRKWFHVVNQTSNRVLLHFGDHLLDHLSGANLFNIFHSLGSAGALYSVLAPYFVSFSLFTRERRLGVQIMEEILGTEPTNQGGKLHKVAHFTDTYHQINGVALTLAHQVRVARSTGKDLTVITCAVEKAADGPGIRNFNPVSVYELPEYPEQKLLFPPFLEMLDYCYEEGFTHIHSATPGPIGLAALAIARILKLPMSGTYHTALPQYARCLTDDADIEDAVWKYTLWYYDQMDRVYVPSRSTLHELVAKGIARDKIHLFPRGVDAARFHPAKSNRRFLEDQYGIGPGPTILYVGRVSKEKNLALLGEVYREVMHTPANCLVVGDGPYLNEMQEGLKDTPCVFTGYVEGEELATLYASCDLFVFPSTTDTFGNVVLEAQASGLPVIVTNSGGPQENILPGQTGFVVQGDDFPSLLHAVETLLDNAELRVAMGKAARRAMEERSFEQAFERTWWMYGESPAEGGVCSLEPSEAGRAVAEG
jgi:glycosyltransferase involved in cell wall biosynthesis